MTATETKQALLRQLPGVDHILELARSDAYLSSVPNSLLVQCIRMQIESLRREILADADGLSSTPSRLADNGVLKEIAAAVEKKLRPNLDMAVNATGVVVHTNLGRSLLAAETIDHLLAIAGRYSNLEYDLSTGKRGSRYVCVEDILCELSGAEAAMVVNNNAGAVLLCLETISRNREVIISRGELVEIGGSFRIPDVMSKSGAILREVGTTNRTHLKDFQQAIGPETGLLLKVHQSNFAIEGFTADVSLKMLVDLGRQHHLPVMEDLGSGMLIDFSRYGLIKEPTVQESIAAGPDVVTFSGDKLLGGPQTGIIVGRKELVDRIKNNPITRALRVDKLTLAALESTLMLYRDEETAVKTIPTLRMLTAPLAAIEAKAAQLHEMLNVLADDGLTCKPLKLTSRVGGGALPQQQLPSAGLGVRIRNMSPNSIERSMRRQTPPLIGRIEADFFVMDLRTVATDELPLIEQAFANLLNRT